MKHIAAAAAIVTFMAAASGAARADTVTDWNQTAIEVMKVARVGGNPCSRSLAMMHVAMSDAINSVGGRYKRVIATGPAMPGASAEAAAGADRGGEVLWTQANLGPAWQEAARQLAAAKGLGLAESARLFALLNMGVVNSFINDWDAKFTYNFWRPVTAIRNGDRDSNDMTERDPGWTPLNATPMHPEYPSTNT